MIETYEPLDTRMFTFVSSVAPDSAPIFKVTGIGGSVITSITAISSDTTHYYALYTMPTSEGFYIGEWYALKTVVGSAYTFTKKFLFKIDAINLP